MKQDNEFNIKLMLLKKNYLENPSQENLEAYQTTQEENLQRIKF